MKTKLLRLGTRGSRLALAQSRWVKEAIEKRYNDIRVEIVKIKTKGDKFLDAPLSKIGGKGLFVKEIEEALLNGKIDIAVHSAKDIPIKIPAPLDIIAYTKREDPRDVFISNRFKSVEEMQEGSIVGTSSLRRRVQLLNKRPRLAITPLRGNVDTRLKRLKEGSLHAILVAKAGLIRMGLEHLITQTLSIDFMIPAIGQGILGIEARRDDRYIKEMVSFLDDSKSRICVSAERRFLKEFGGSCQIPIAAHCYLKGKALYMRCMIASIDGREMLRKEGMGLIEDPESLGKRLAEEMHKSGAQDILKEIMEIGEDAL
ncbi:MAG TPA: hydroxymethylbilane synthase [Desulfobacteraceae bacterium]|nr:hydroxymethylbilane synthase [Desulfobacteraceae bacterium]